MKKLIFIGLLSIMFGNLVLAQNDCSVKSSLPEEVQESIINYIEQDSTCGKLLFARIQLNWEINSLRIWIKRYDEFPESISNYLICNHKRIKVGDYEIGYFTDEELYLDEMLLCENCPYSSDYLSEPHLYIEIKIKGPKRFGKVIRVEQ